MDANDASGIDPDTSVPPFSVPDLEPGDVLLSYGVGWEADLILFLDSGLYSHAGMWDGSQVVQMRAPGCVHTPLDVLLGRQHYVDAYRFVSDTVPPHHMNEPGWPAEPVLDRGEHFFKDGTSYAYDEAAMLGVILLFRALPGNPIKRAAIVYLLTKAEAWIQEQIERGKSSMMCTQLPCTCLYQADDSEAHRYGLQVKLDVHFNRPPGVEQERLAGERPEVAEDVARIRRLVAEWIGDPSLAEAGARVGAEGTALAGSALIPLGSVTPNDMQTSPSLTLLGRLPKPSPA